MRIPNTNFEVGKFSFLARAMDDFIIVSASEDGEVTELDLEDTGELSLYSTVTIRIICYRIEIQKSKNR